MLVNRFIFRKDTSDIALPEITYVKNPVSFLINTNVEIEGIFSVWHMFILTMIDGKVCNADTQTKSTNIATYVAFLKKKLKILV